MTDILRVLPHFPVNQYANLIPALEKNQVVCANTMRPLYLDTIADILHTDNHRSDHFRSSRHWQTDAAPTIGPEASM